jgi:tRNA threonylcarbamoyladenosine biosynthesis protein TsaE
MTAARTVATSSEAETVALGTSLAAELRAGDVVALYGTLGTGKTHFIKGVCAGLGAGTHVTSPTFTIINEYRGGRIPVYHFDFYRMKDLRELREIGFDEYLSGDGVCLLEWAERVEGLLPARRLDVTLAFGPGESDRTVTIREHAGGVPA